MKNLVIIAGFSANNLKAVVCLQSEFRKNGGRLSNGYARIREDANLGRRLVAILLSALMLLSSGSVSVFAATTGTITGRVFDGESGEALAGVNVQLKGTTFITVSSADGTFRFTNVPPGKYDVEASLVGYAPTLLSAFEVVMDLVVRAEVEMTATVEEEPEVIIIEDLLLTNPDATQTVYIRTAEDQKLAQAAPNSLYQVPSLLTTVPGVVADADGFPRIRGGRDDSIGWQIEGIPVTNPIDNTFGTNLVTVGLKKIEVYTGGYQAEYGSAISGILNEVKKTGSDVDGAYYEVSMGSQQHSGIYFEAGDKFEESGLEWYFGNYSWQGDFRRSMFHRTTSTDNVLKLVQPVGTRDRLTLLALNGSAQTDVPLSEDPSIATAYMDQNRANQGHGLVGFTWSHQMSPDAHWLIRPYYFRQKNNIRALATDFGDSSEAKSIQRGLQAQIYKAFGNTHQVTAGAWYINGSNHFHRFIPMLFGMADFEYTSFVKTRQTALYIQDKWNINRQLVADLGLRYDKMHYDKSSFEDLSESQISPRVGFAWSQDPRTVIRASYGRFIQFVPTSVQDRLYTDPFWDGIYTPDSDLNPERASSYDISYERQTSRNTLVRITPFYRKYTNLLERIGADPAFPDDPPFVFVNVGKAFSRGIEFSTEHKWSDNTRGWLSYTLADVKGLNASSPGGYNALDWDQRHTVDATLQHRNGLMSYSLRMQYGTGLPWTDFAIDTDLNTRRVDEYFIVTAGAQRKIGDDSEIGVHIYNLFNSGEVLSRNGDGSERSAVQPRFFQVTWSQKL